MIIDPIVSDNIKKTDIEQVQKHKQEVLLKNFLKNSYGSKGKGK